MSKLHYSCHLIKGMNINFDFWFPSHWVSMLAFDILSCNKTFCTLWGSPQTIQFICIKGRILSVSFWKQIRCSTECTHLINSSSAGKDKVILQQCGDNKRTKLLQGLLWHLKLRTRCLPQSKQTRIPGKTNCPVVYEEMFLEKEWHALLIAAVCFKLTQLQAIKKHYGRPCSFCCSFFG